MNRIIIVAFMAIASAQPIVAQVVHDGPMWDGYVQRGRIKIRAGGSVWHANGVAVSHTEEIYESADVAQYILTRLKGRMRLTTEIVPNAGVTNFKVTTRGDVFRIAWVCGKELRYLESRSYAAVIAVLTDWAPLRC